MSSSVTAHKRFARRGWGRWHRVNAANRSGLPRQWRPWLLDDSSLTAKLQRRCGGRLRVQVLTQYRGQPRLSEARALRLARHQHCFIREVLLKGPGDTPWVFARSIFPLTSLTGRLRHLTRLANRPLGAYLFSHPQLERSPIEVAALSPEECSLPPDWQQQRILWGRRSIFYLYNKPLLVSEIFLPTLLEHTP